MKKFVCIAAVVSMFGSLAGCAAEPAEPTGSSTSSIIGGVSDPGHPSVGLLRSVVQITPDGQPYAVAGCTATLIAPSVMVTAAHCVAGRHYWDEVSFEQAPDPFAPHGAPGWIPAALMASPDYDGDTSHGHDIAVVLLGARPDRPLSPVAAPPPVGSILTAVGYGMNVYGSDGTGAGERRTVDIPLVSVGPREMIAGREGQGTCHGDSGGPLFAGDVIVGITSYGDTVDCNGADHFMRVDDNLAFLRRFVPTL